MNKQLLLFLFLGTISIQKSVSAELSDTLNHYQLQDVEVKGKRLRSHLKALDDASIVDMSLMDYMPRILGNADPIHYAQLLPGVQTNSEYDAGLHVQGCDNSHNYVSLDGVPIYNATHLLGFFSIFNASHFSEMSLTKSSTSASFPNRLGGSVDMLTPTWICGEDSLQANGKHGEIAVGPMSSQGTVKLPIGKRSMLMVSARAAYLNLLYSKWLEMDGDNVNYDFADYNATYITQLDDANVIKAEAYWGYDNLKIGQADQGLQTKIKWDNTMAALYWYSRHSKWQTEQSVYFTRYANRVRLNETSIDVGVRSYIYDLGYKGRLKFGHWDCGVDVIRHELMPQDIATGGTINANVAPTKKQRTVEASTYMKYLQPLSQRWALETGLRFTYYYNKDRFASLDPNIKLRWDASQTSQFSLNLGVHHQYLYQTGFSSMGLPTEFWLSSSNEFRPQYAYNASLQGNFWLKDREYRLITELYFKKLEHQIENSGNIFDILYSSYSLEGALMKGKGYNYGANIMLEKRRGKLTGWVSYSFGRAKRRFDGDRYAGWYSASHERIHELNAVATYKIGKRMELGATYVLASGVPFTRIKYAYMVSNNIVSEYGPYNGDRIKPYMRLDLSMNYDFKNSGDKRSGINFSLYNATMYNNILSYRIKVYKGQVRYATFSFLMPILPSISYYYKF